MSALVAGSLPSVATALTTTRIDGVYARCPAWHRSMLWGQCFDLCRAVSFWASLSVRFMILLAFSARVCACTIFRGYREIHFIVGATNKQSQPAPHPHTASPSPRTPRPTRYGCQPAVEANGWYHSDRRCSRKPGFEAISAASDVYPAGARAWGSRLSQGVCIDATASRPADHRGQCPAADSSCFA